MCLLAIVKIMFAEELIAVWVWSGTTGMNRGYQLGTPGQVGTP